MYQLVTSLSPEHHAGAYFKQAHAHVSAKPTNTLPVQAPFGERCSALFFAFLAALFAGVLLAFTPYGVLALVFALGVLYHNRSRSYGMLLAKGLGFSLSFIPVFAITHAFLQEMDAFFEASGAQLAFSLVFVLLVALASFSLLGLIQISPPKVSVKEEDQRFFESAFAALCGALSALMLLTQKLSPLFVVVRQLDVKELWETHLLLSIAAAVGFAGVIFVCWAIASYFLRDEYVSLWVTDSLSVLAWFSLYKSMLVLRPHMFSWQYNLLLAIVACCAGVYYWMSVRLEITYQYIDMYSKAARADTLLHIFSGWQFFSARILLKRFIAVIAFLAMGSFMVKTYLFYRGITLRDAIIQKLKSL